MYMQLSCEPVIDIATTQAALSVTVVPAGAPGDPLVFDSDPITFAQGWIIASDQKAQTIDVRLMPGYEVLCKPGRIKVFTPDGVALPHMQDPVQEHTDLGKPCCSALEVLASNQLMAASALDIHRQFVIPRARRKLKVHV